MLVEELKELARSIQEQQAEEQKREMPPRITEIPL